MDDTTTTPGPATLAPTAAIDSDHPAVRAFAERHAVGADDRERAVALALAVRDGFRYDPYKADLSPQGMRASTVLAQGYGWCVPKAVLLAAVSDITRAVFDMQGLSLVIYGALLVVIIAFLPNGLIDLFQRLGRKTQPAAPAKEGV